MADLRVEDLLDDINTDAMAPAWACFDWKPADIARNAYAGMPLDEFARGHDPLTRQIIAYGGLFAFTKAFAHGAVQLPPNDTLPRAMNLAEKILAKHVIGAGDVFLKPGDSVCVRVDGGYSHEF